MTAPRTRALLQRKLTSLAAYLDELDAVTPATVAEYVADSTVRRAVERLVQVVTECAADAADLLLAVNRREKLSRNQARKTEPPAAHKRLAIAHSASSFLADSARGAVCSGAAVSLVSPQPQVR
jgi:hypothetical protein